MKKFCAYLKSLRARTIVSWIGIVLVMLLCVNVGGARNQIGMTVVSGLLFAVGVYLLLEREEAKKDRVNTAALIVFLCPLLLFLLFTIVSFFWMSMGMSTLIINLLSALGVIGAFIFGKEIKNDEKLPKHVFIYAIIVGLAFLSLSNLIASLADYGFFYLTRYKGMVYFADGVKKTITDEMAILDGFSVAYVSPEYGTLPSFILAASLCALFFLKPKEDKILFWFIAVGGSIGLLNMVLLCNVYALIVLIPVLLVALLFRFLKLPSPAPLWERIVSLVMLAMVVALVVFIVVVAAKGNNIYASSKLLSKIFNNGKLLKGINQTVNAVFQKGFLSFPSFFGMPVYGEMSKFNDLFTITSSTLTASSWGGSQAYWTSFNLHTFEFSALMEGGTICFFMLCLFMVSLFPLFRRYVRHGENIQGSRYFFLSLVLAYFLYQSLFSDALPFLGASNYVSPFVLNPYFILVIAIIGYVYTPSPFLLKKLSKGGRIHA